MIMSGGLLQMGRTTIARMARRHLATYPRDGTEHAVRLAVCQDAGTAGYAVAAALACSSKLMEIIVSMLGAVRPTPILDIAIGDRAMQIKEGMLDDAGVIALLDFHLKSARAETAPGSAHALDLSGLKTPDIRFWSIWDGGTLLGVGALKRLSEDHAEVKSMHIASRARRQGVGGKLLRHILSEARASGFNRVSLETGSWDYFRPAVALYLRYGFSYCEPFGDYRPDPNSIFMTLRLSEEAVNTTAGVNADG